MRKESNLEIRQGGIQLVDNLPHFGYCLLKAARPEKRCAADEDIRAGPRTFAGSFEIDPTVHANGVVESSLTPPCICLLNLWQCFINEFLPAEPGIHRHDQQVINLVKVGLNQADAGGRID